MEIATKSLYMLIEGTGMVKKFQIILAIAGATGSNEQLSPRTRYENLKKLLEDKHAISQIIGTIEKINNKTIPLLDKRREAHEFLIKQKLSTEMRGQIKMLITLKGIADGLDEWSLIEKSEDFEGFELV